MEEFKRTLLGFSKMSFAVMEYLLEGEDKHDMDPSLVQALYESMLVTMDRVKDVLEYIESIEKEKAEGR